MLKSMVSIILVSLAFSHSASAATGVSNYEKTVVCRAIVQEVPGFLAEGRKTSGALTSDVLYCRNNIDIAKDNDGPGYNFGLVTNRKNVRENLTGYAVILTSQTGAKTGKADLHDLQIFEF